MSANIPPEIENLTPRERQIYLLVIEGKGNPYISKTLGISVNTVRTHLDNAREKLGLRGHRGWNIPQQRDVE